MMLHAVAEKYSRRQRSGCAPGTGAENIGHHRDAYAAPQLNCKIVVLVRHMTNCRATVSHAAQGIKAERVAPGLCDRSRVVFQVGYFSAPLAHLIARIARQLNRAIARSEQARSRHRFNVSDACLPARR
jgi:hypothetical protein